ncbi:O-antigen ligase family protein [Alphaproteobacteria bacterium]|nr:O-antigen ligase family protein [Alphaproteobacteria bacterium]
MSFISEYSYNSFSRSIPFIRYIIIFIVINSIIFHYKIERLFYFFFVSNFLIFFIVINLVFQYFFGYDVYGNIPYDLNRLSGFYGDDLIAGQVIFILSLPAITFPFLIKSEKYISIYFFLTLLTVIIGILLSGQRTALFNFIISLMIFTLVFNKIIKLNYIFFFIVLFSSIISLFYFIPSFYARFIKVTYNQLANYLDTSYSAYQESAIILWLKYPIFGVGLKNYRNLCSENLFFSNYNSDPCSTHPHNINLELLSELGVIGFFIFLSFFLFYTINVSIKINKIDYRSKLYFAAFFITTLPIMFSVIPSGSFFTNTHAIPFWLYLSIASSSLIPKKNN